MTSRIVAVTLGLIAGVTLFLFLSLAWTQTIAFFDLDRSGLVALVTGRPARLAWSAAAGLTAFGWISSLAALIGGAIETAAARRRLTDLRLDPALAGCWNAADWRVALAPTAIGERAEAMIALLPVDAGDERRVVVDTHLLVGLGPLWLDRLSLRAAIGPLPALALGQGVALALIASASGARWDIVAAAGATGWLLITLAHCVVRALLSPLVAGAVDTATAATRPLISMQTLAPKGAVSTAASIDADGLAAAVERALTGPIERLAAAAERLSSAGGGPSREQAIDAALAEIRAGIERLLDAGGE